MAINIKTFDGKEHTFVSMEKDGVTFLCNGGVLKYTLKEVDQMLIEHDRIMAIDRRLNL